MGEINYPSLKLFLSDIFVTVMRKETYRKLVPEVGLLLDCLLTWFSSLWNWFVERVWRGG
jgi:hypothetical protein